MNHKFFANLPFAPVDSLVNRKKLFADGFRIAAFQENAGSHVESTPAAIEHLAEPGTHSCEAGTSAIGFVREPVKHHKTPFCQLLPQQNTKQRYNNKDAQDIDQHPSPVLCRRLGKLFRQMNRNATKASNRQE